MTNLRQTNSADSHTHATSNHYLKRFDNASVLSAFHIIKRPCTVFLVCSFSVFFFFFGHIANILCSKVPQRKRATHKMTKTNHLAAKCIHISCVNPFFLVDLVQSTLNLFIFTRFQYYRSRFWLAHSLAFYDSFDSNLKRETK